MGKTNIEYADEVSNPLYARPVGDESVKVGTFCEKPDKDGTCQNCWAETLNLRFGNKLAFDKSNRDKIEWKFRPKELNRMARLNAKKPMSKKFEGLSLVVFCFDTFDIFQPSISDEMRDIVFEFYDRLTNLILLVQTTYPAKMNHYFKKRYGAEGLPKHYWLGMSAGTQPFLDRNIEHLEAIKARRKYVIFEPLLEAITFDRAYLNNIDLVIIGGESGAKSRACNINWIRSLVKQCKGLEVSVLVKQLGAKAFDGYFHFSNGERHEDWLKLQSGKGGDISEFPEDLRVREFPV